MEDNYSALVDEVNRKADFESGAFTGMLQRVKTLFDENVFTEQNEGVEGYFSYRAQIGSLKDYFSFPVQYHEKGKLYQRPVPDGNRTGAYFSTFYDLGIYDKSPVKPEAWDFIKFLLSEEMQELTNTQDRDESYLGFPMNKAVLERQLNRLQQDGKFEAEVESQKFKTIKVSEADIQVLKQTISSANKLRSKKSSKIEDVITEESKAFFTGQKTAEAVAKLIQNKVTTYLNE
ncbi:extracellular solute-binding protein [Paenibacillus ehimensis]|uniref:Extracellular solute-binding protein n=1 Tax=Paenibacillus ehimensis TaxID=79264 RepID=A0ABT8VB83_9BACL|nr:extracellular solute-binding protein [Paenibacillus ehimensis]MDO3678248.1 extracellular solute-binding protein [Paenibacillus ehimensis]